MSSQRVDESDPDLVLANRVAVFAELTSLSANTDKLVVSLAKHILDGAPSKSILQKNMARKKPHEFYRELRYRKN